MVEKSSARGITRTSKLGLRDPDGNKRLGSAAIRWVERQARFGLGRLLEFGEGAVPEIDFLLVTDLIKSIPEKYSSDSLCLIELNHEHNKIQTLMIVVVYLLQALDPIGNRFAYSNYAVPSPLPEPIIFHKINLGTGRPSGRSLASKSLDRSVTTDRPDKYFKKDATKRENVVWARCSPFSLGFWRFVSYSSIFGSCVDAPGAISVHFSRPKVRNTEFSKSRTPIPKEEYVFWFDIVMPTRLLHSRGRGS